MSTSITKKPDKTVSNLCAPKRGSNNRTMTSTWKVPAAMTKSTSNSKAEHLLINWVLNIGGTNKTLKKQVGTGTTSSSVNLNNVTIGGTTYTRSSFYPNSKKKLTSVTIKVTGTNSKGNGATAKQTRKFETPRAPEIDEITFNTSSGVCSTTVTADAGTDYKERYDTKYTVTVKNTQTGQTNVASDSSSTSNEFTLTYDAGDYQSLVRDEKFNDYIQITVSAFCRGYAGDSKTATRNFYVSYPAKATIEDAYISSKDSTGSLSVSINTNETTEHPVDIVRLEYLANVSYENASDIPASEANNWEDSGIEDNGNCTALTMPIGSLIPDRGKYTWVRVKTIHAHEGVLYRYSDYKRVTDLETPPAEAAEDSITIISAVSGADGESAVVQLGWNASGTDDSTGTELTWSDEEDTWKSTKEPSNFEFTWSDGRYPATGTQEYHDSAEIVIKELEEGKKYFVRARRYYEGETTSYGRYSNTATVITSEKPIGVVASCNRYVTDGEPLSVYWTFSGNGLQKEWQMVDSNGTVVASGEGGIGATQISSERLKELAENNSITFHVRVSTGSGFVNSEEHTVTIQERPTLSLTADATLTAQPLSFTAQASRPCDLTVIVTSQGSSGQFPDGYKMQAAGDTIHSNVYTPAWTNGSATITLPTCDFWDLGSYTLSVVAEDRTTKLRSEVVEKDIAVAWGTKAKDPDNFVTVTPQDYRTESGEHIQAVEIALTAPTGSSSTDVYDIYRMDGATAHLINEDGFPLNYTAVDEYAPFGDDVFYRIALRTADGDVEFADKEYTLESDTIRYDWQGGSLELPYGNSIADSYAKNVEFRQHMDGSVDGYWNQNIERKGSYSSSVIKLIQPQEINLARQLARYAGAVFVRTANGSAYTADVQVSDLSVKNKAVTLMAFDVTEVGLTDEFMLPTPFEQGD